MQTKHEQEYIKFGAPKGDGCYMYRIREIRIAHEETQQQIAELLETTQQAYSKYEKGINEMPVWRIVKLCEHYHVSVDYILGLTENPEPTKAVAIR